MYPTSQHFYRACKTTCPCGDADLLWRYWQGELELGLRRMALSRAWTWTSYIICAATEHATTTSSALHCCRTPQRPLMQLGYHLHRYRARIENLLHHLHCYRARIENLLRHLSEHCYKACFHAVGHPSRLLTFPLSTSRVKNYAIHILYIVHRLRSIDSTANVAQWRYA